MSTLRHLRPVLALASGIAWAIGFTPGAGAAAAPPLQVLTTVVNIDVPVSAFDPSTGLANVTVARGLVLQVQSDRGWKLQMRATRAAFSTNSVPANTKPVSDLQLRHAEGGAVVVPSTSYNEIAKGGNTHGVIELAFDVIFQASSADAAGLYTVNLEFDLQ